MASLIRQSRPAIVTVVTLVGLFGVLLAFQAALSSGGNTKVAQSPEFFTWSAFASVSVVIYVQVFTRTVALVRPPSTAVLVVSIVAYLLVAAVVFAMLTGYRIEGALETVPLAMRPLYVVAEIAAAPAVLGLWLTHARLQQFDQQLSQWAEKSEALLAELMTSRANLGRCLAGLSFIASTGLINTAALRTAYLAHGVPSGKFPSSAVLLYGASITTIVALIYVPAFLAWRERVTHVIDMVYPTPTDARPTEEWTNGRARLRELLGADTTIGRTLGTASGILAPLAVSFLGLYIPELQAGP